MGYGIYLTGRPRKGERLGIAQDNTTLVEAIRAAIESEITDPLQRRLTTLNVPDNELKLHLHPSAEDVEISAKDGEFNISAKTSGAGPGYHAMLVELLDNLASRAGIILSWKDLQVGWSDETGYHEHRDMELLRGETIRWLRTISRHIAEAGEDSTNILVNMPIGDRPICDAFVLAPMGAFSRDWFQSACDADDEEIAAMAEGFHPAWHGPDRAEYWANIGRYLTLWELDWTVPINDTERDLYETMLACYDRARRLEPAMTVPEAQLREARGLLEDGDPAAPPRALGVGFRRGMLDRSLNYGWSARIPGYFRREHETDGDKQSDYFWFGDREIHHTVLIIKSVEGGTTATDFVERNSEPRENEIVIPFANPRDWLAGRAVVKKRDDLCTVQAMFGVTWKEEQRILVLTIVHEDTPEGQDWSKALLESVSHPKPEAD